MKNSMRIRYRSFRSIEENDEHIELILAKFTHLSTNVNGILSRHQVRRASQRKLDRKQFIVVCCGYRDRGEFGGDVNEVLGDRCITWYIVASFCEVFLHPIYLPRTICFVDMMNRIRTFFI